MRCYNGCPDGELKALIDARIKAEKRLKKINPEARCVYFPSPGYFQVWLNNEPVCGWDLKFEDKVTAIEAAIAGGKI
jgi:hypothetical protein